MLFVFCMCVCLLVSILFFFFICFQCFFLLVCFVYIFILGSFIYLFVILFVFLLLFLLLSILFCFFTVSFTYMLSSSFPTFSSHQIISIRIRCPFMFFSLFCLLGTLFFSCFDNTFSSSIFTFTYLSHLFHLYFPISSLYCLHLEF